MAGLNDESGDDGSRNDEIWWSGGTGTASRLAPSSADFGQEVVKVTAAAVNNTDIWTRQGAYGLPGDPSARAGWLGAFDSPRIQGGASPALWSR